jgi:senataxin
MYLDARKGRLLVCAPSNKAVSVIASRFLAATTGSKYSAVLVGDSEKLLTEDDQCSSLRNVLVWTWLEALEGDYRKLQQSIEGNLNKEARAIAYKRAMRLQQRLQNATLLDSGIADALKDDTTPARGIVALIDEVLGRFKTISDDTLRRTLISRADVIFCTLATSGSLLLLSTNIGPRDLIVDEASACTEPEVCVPLAHFLPKRVLLVGDPRQLPAFVTSTKAVQLGLDKSLQERLMIDNGHAHFMLDVQYRMHPDICRFPSFKFYHNKLSNGPNVIRKDYVGTYSLLNRQPYIFMQIFGMEERSFSGSYCNVAEARAIVKLVMQLREQGRHDPNWHSKDRIRIITFYYAQVMLLNRLLRERGLGDKIVVGTGRSLYYFGSYK